MGYACPVCDVPQRDAEHLANHLALTAMVHGHDHEAWLDDHTPGWAESGPAALGERVAPLAEPAPYDEVFEDTVHGHVGEGHDHPPVDRIDAGPTPPAPDDETTRAALAEARELTRRMRASTAAGTDDASAADEGRPAGVDGEARTADGADDDPVDGKP